MISIHQINSIIKHKEGVNCVIQLKNLGYASCGNDNVILIFSQSFQVKQTLEGHTGGVTYISELGNGSLISTSYDETIKIWRPLNDSYECIKTIGDHKDLVFKAIEISNKRICSVSTRVINLWGNDEPYHHIASIKYENSCLFSFIEDSEKKYIISGSSGKDNTLRFWDNSQYECLKVVPKIECFGRNSLFEFKKNRLIVCGNLETNIFNFKTFQLESKLKLKDIYAVKGIAAAKNKNLFLIAGKSISYLNMDTLELTVLKRDAFFYPGTFIILQHQNILVTSALDCIIKRWRIEE